MVVYLQIDQSMDKTDQQNLYNSFAYCIFVAESSFANDTHY